MVANEMAAMPEPTWAVAELFPHQGSWSTEEYLGLDTNRLVEFSHGQLEVLPVPTKTHQRLVAALFRLLTAFLASHPRGEAIFAPYRVQLWPDKFREPDIVFLTVEHADHFRDEYALGADLVMEVVSPDDRRRDLETKRREYAQAGIPEYWIVDPETRRITVLTLAGETYAVHGEFGPGVQATSVLLSGFAVDVAALYAQIERSA